MMEKMLPLPASIEPYLVINEQKPLRAPMLAASMVPVEITSILDLPLCSISMSSQLFSRQTCSGILAPRFMIHNFPNTCTFVGFPKMHPNWGCQSNFLSNFRWSGSVYKLVWRDLMVWIILYYILNACYRFGMNEDQRTIFEFICRYCDKFSNLIPLTFVLGFYVNLVIGRWWVMWDLLPWPDNLALYISTSFPGKDELSRMTRHTIMRYINLASAQAKSHLSPKVMKRFPTLHHYVDAGLMMEDEHKIMAELMKKSQKLYFVPLLWASILVTKARDDGRMPEMHWKSCMDAIVDSRTRLARSLHIELVNIPLVYSQVVSLSVYTFSLSCLLGRQYIQVDKYPVDLYFPIFAVLQLVFYWGWLKVAEAMIDPYGDDDADFDLNYYIDKNIHVSNMIADHAMQADFPEAVKHPHWSEDDRRMGQQSSIGPKEEARINTLFNGSCANCSSNAHANVAQRVHSSPETHWSVESLADLRKRHCSTFRDVTNRFDSSPMEPLACQMSGSSDVDMPHIVAGKVMESPTILRNEVQNLEPVSAISPKSIPLFQSLPVTEGDPQLSIPPSANPTSVCALFRSAAIAVQGGHSLHVGSDPADVSQISGVKLIPPNQEEETRC